MASSQVQESFKFFAKLWSFNKFIATPPRSLHFCGIYFNESLIIICSHIWRLLSRYNFLDTVWFFWLLFKWFVNFQNSQLSPHIKCFLFVSGNQHLTLCWEDLYRANTVKVFNGYFMRNFFLCFKVSWSGILDDTNCCLNHKVLIF